MTDHARHNEQQQTKFVCLHQDHLWESADHRHPSYHLIIGDVVAVYMIDDGRTFAIPRPEFDLLIKRYRETYYVEGNQVRRRKRNERPYPKVGYE
jgi:hypothetical protein